MEFTNHAIFRYLERTGEINSVKRKIRETIKLGKEIKPKDNLNKLLNYNCKQAKYYLLNNIIAVIVNNKIVTIMKYNNKTRDKWTDL